MTMTPVQNQNGQPEVSAPSRPWMAPLIAVGIAGVVLTILLIPGVLQYPAPTPTPAAPLAPDPAALAALQESNRTLEDRIESQKRLLESGVCLAPEGYQFPDLPNRPQLSPEDKAALPPPPVALAQSRPQLPHASSPNTLPAAPIPSGSASGSLLNIIDQSTVLILAQKTNGFGQGTGFYVAPNIIMTNYHVVTGASPDKLIVVNPGIGVAKATLVAKSSGSGFASPDFALLRVGEVLRASPAPRPTAILTFAPEIERMDNIVAVGFPGLVTQSDEKFQQLIQGDATNLPTPAITEGIVTALQVGNNISSVVLHTAQVTPGNSGGPLLDRCGQVMGVNTFIIAQQEGRMNYALSSSDIRRFLTSNNVEPLVGAGRCPTSQTTTPSPTPPPPATTRVPGAVPAPAPAPNR